MQHTLMTFHLSSAVRGAAMFNKLTSLGIECSVRQFGGTTVLSTNTRALEHADELNQFLGGAPQGAPIPEPIMCEECGCYVESIIGCPDGAEICKACFALGRH